MIRVSTEPCSIGRPFPSVFREAFALRPRTFLEAAVAVDRRSPSSIGIRGENPIGGHPGSKP